MQFYKATLVGIILSICSCFASNALHPKSLSAQKIFENGSDPMLVNLTYLSYLTYDKQDDFKTYKLMYGLDNKKKIQLEAFLRNETQYYTNQKWNLKFLSVGKGLFSNNDSPGAVIASQCTPAAKNEPLGLCEVKIAFRGTRSLDDWGNNVNFLKTPLRFKDNRINNADYEKTFKVGQVHQGFLKAYNTVAQVISDTLFDLRQQNPKSVFIVRVGGHSLGGSLATLCAAHLLINFKRPQDDLQLETYGSPRTVGEKLSAELVAKLGIDNIIRFVMKDSKNVSDMIPTIPYESILRAQFRHVGNECDLIASGPDIYEGFKQIKILRTPHRIEGYRAAYMAQRQCSNSEKQASSAKPSLLKKAQSSIKNLF